MPASDTAHRLDVNGDGYADLIVGAYSYDHGQPEEGRALGWYGRPD